MINHARLRSDLSRLGRESEMLTATVKSLAADEFAAPSLCEGWTRAHAVAHLISNSDALVRLINNAVTGSTDPMYASKEARTEEIEQIAALPREELVARLDASIANFAQQAERLSGELAAEEVTLVARTIPSTSIVAVRISEVVMHHHDLDTAWTIEEADPDSLLNAVEAAVRAMRAKDAPGLTLVTEERDEWVIGDGAQRVESDREGLLLWLARGDDEHIESERPLPVLPAW